MTWANITFVLLLIQKPIAILGICLFAGWMPVNKAYTLIAGLLIMSFVVSMSTHLTRWVDLYGLIGWLILSKVCAFLGNDYDFMNGRSRLRRPNEPLKEKIKEQIVNLIENEDVATFLVGEIGGFEQDAYDCVLEVKKIYPDIQIVLVVSRISELNETGKDEIGYVVERRGFSDFVCPDECVRGNKRWCIVYRNRHIVENTDFIIAYNRYEGRAYEFCKTATRKGVVVIELYNAK